MVVDLLPATINSLATMENGTLASNGSLENSGGSLTTPPSPPSTLTATDMPMNGGGLSSRSPSSVNLKSSRAMDEAARAAVASFAHDQAPLLAAMFAQRFIHIANQTGVDIDALHSHFMGEFIPAFLDSLHSSMSGATSTMSLVDCCEMCSELGQRASFLASCQSSAMPMQAVPQTPTGSFQQRSNSVSFGTRGKNSPPLSMVDSSPGNPSLLASSVHTASIHSLNKTPHSSNGTLKHFKNLLGQFVRRRTISTSSHRDGNSNSVPSETPGLLSPALSLPVDVVLEGVLGLHRKGPGSTHTTLSSRSGLSNSRDLLTSIPQHCELEKDDDDDQSTGKEDVDTISTDMTKSTEYLDDSPWVSCHVRLLRSSAGPLLVIRYPDSNECGISLSVVSQVRAATIGDELTNDEYAFILISSSLNCRILLKASSRADMNRWLDALRPCVAFHPSAMVPLFPVNKFGISLPTSQTNGNLGANHGLARFGGNLLGNIPNHHQPSDPSPTLKRSPAGPADNLSRSTSFVGRRRIQTSPAVDLYHLYKSNRQRNHNGNDVETPTGAFSTASSTDFARANSTDVAITTPPRSASPALSQSSQVGSTPQSQQPRPLSTFPWYWGKVSRTEAAQVVCRCGESGNGCFVVRQSESQQGDYVITFNCHGEAKHMRLKVFDDGRCQMDQYAFSSVQALVDHFRTTALTIDSDHPTSSSMANGVMLTNWVSHPSHAVSTRR